MEKVIVLNRQKAIALVKQDSSLDRVLISISALDEDKPNFNNENYSIRDICFCFFNDEEEGETIISDDDAKRIAEFAKKWWGKCDQIVVHCDAGVSRSAGVAAAILKHFTNDDTQIFDNTMYYPNMMCYRKVLTKLEEEDK